MRRYLEFGSGWHILFKFQEDRINRIELTALLWVGKDFVRFLNAFEECIVVSILVNTSEVE